MSSFGIYAKLLHSQTIYAYSGVIAGQLMALGIWLSLDTIQEMGVASLKAVYIRASHFIAEQCATLVKTKN